MPETTRGTTGTESKREGNEAESTGKKNGTEPKKNGTESKKNGTEPEREETDPKRSPVVEPLSDKEITQRLVQLSQRARKLGLTEDEIRKLFQATAHASSSSWSGYLLPVLGLQLRFRTKFGPVRTRWKLLGLTVLVALTAAFFGRSHVRAYVRDSECLIGNNFQGFFTEMFRPLVRCEMCSSLTALPVVYNISSEEFTKRFAYSGVPVLIKGAMGNWSAIDTFSFEYFKDLYLNTKGALELHEEECQFFPYGTEFNTLSDALLMSDERASYQEGELPWYIGWSNCDPTVGRELRKQYEKPYFLPADSENNPVDWIFMGGPGLGAGIHIDDVSRPSWQAQISGTKTWTLIPSPECDAVCPTFNVIVEKGDIFVIDSNIWYHRTLVNPGELSITIGSEFD